MSLSWLDQLTLLVHPRRLVLDHRPWRGERRVERCALPPPAAGEADWQPALTAAAGLLATAPQGAALRIVVADALVRYALLPWNDTLLGRRERQAMALALLRNALGDKAASLEIALDRPRFGENGLAAGIERALLDGLRRIAKQRHQRLGSIQPRLLAELQVRRRQLADGWFACVDDDWLCVVGLRRGAPVRIRNHRGSPLELAGLLAADGALVDSRRLDVAGNTEIGIGSDWEVHQLPFAVWEAAGA